MQLHHQVEEDMVLSFPTPVHARSVAGADEINPGLRAAILSRAPPEPGIARSNVGGWRTDDNLFSWPTPECGHLMQAVALAALRMTAFTTGRAGLEGQIDANAWANVLGRGAYNFPHSHPGALWSGVYYVDAGTAADRGLGGQIEFLDPRAGAGSLPVPGAPFGGRLSYVPRAGMLLLFPGWLTHYVHPYQGVGPRISIAFNVTGVDLRSDPDAGRG